MVTHKGAWRNSHPKERQRHEKRAKVGAVQKWSKYIKMIYKRKGSTNSIWKMLQKSEKVWQKASLLQGEHCLEFFANREFSQVPSCEIVSWSSLRSCVPPLATRKPTSSHSQSLDVRNQKSQNAKVELFSHVISIWLLNSTVTSIRHFCYVQKKWKNNKARHPHPRHLARPTTSKPLKHGSKAFCWISKSLGPDLLQFVRHSLNGTCFLMSWMDIKMTSK